MTRFNLRDRSYRFSLELFKLLNTMPFSIIKNEVFKQLIRSGASIGANIEEADSSQSRKDLKYKFTIAKKEAAETLYWLKLLRDSNSMNNENNKVKLIELIGESDQILKILGSIIRKI